MSRFQFVADHQHAYEVKRLCELVEVKRSSYYSWKAAAPSREARAAADAQLACRIREVHEEDNTMGARRVTAELNDGAGEAQRVNHKRVARVMNRDFTAEAPNQRYVGDITYLPIADGSNLYLATVIDCHSRRLVGWSIADHMRTELVEDALRAAAATRGSVAGAIFHSDHGSVYTSKDYAKLCAELGVTPVHGCRRYQRGQQSGRSVQRDRQTRGPADDNCWPDELSCRRQVFRWLTRYNTRRRHSWCRYLSPIAYEALTVATLPSAA